jgi:enamine deaminase RidA (YjgF/YER057c/UK114 family)
MSAEARLKELGITLPEVAKPRWAYVPCVRSGNLVFVSGQIGTENGRIVHPGKLGREIDVTSGQQAARACALSALAVVRQELGSLDLVLRVVKLTVYVASAEGFTDQPTVANGASDFLREIIRRGGARRAGGGRRSGAAPRRIGRGGVRVRSAGVTLPPGKPLALTEVSRIDVREQPVAIPEIVDVRAVDADGVEL